MVNDMTAKHTPGPWWRDDDGFIAAGSGDSYVTVADFDCGGAISHAERLANEALAMAGPDMLAALKAVLGAVEVHDHWAVAKAIDAIAKAEGRA